MKKPSTVNKTLEKKPDAQEPKKLEQLALHKCRNGHIVEMVPNSLRVVIHLTQNGKPITAYITENLCPLCLVDALNHIAATAPYAGPAPVEAPTAEETKE